MAKRRARKRMGSPHPERGGQALVRKYGREWMRHIAALGGRATKGIPKRRRRRGT